MSKKTESNHVSGAVRQRVEDDGGTSSLETRRPRLHNAGSSMENYDYPQVLAFAARNRRGRFYISSKENYFAGIKMEKVLLDSGCSSLLLPFPTDTGFPEAFYNARICRWSVALSRGTGALRSPVLKITKHVGSFSCILAGKDGQPQLPLLRFHVGSDAANRLLDPQNRQVLDDKSIAKLNDFIGQLGDKTAAEREFALLGQDYFRQVIYCQIDDVALCLRKDCDGKESLIAILGTYKQKLEPLVQAFETFDDSENDDGDEDEEEYRLCRDHDTDDYVDEMDGR